MNLYFRLFMAWFRSRYEVPLSTADSCSQAFRVGLLDIDLFGHMNNGRYLQIMDVARFRWLLRTGTISAMSREGWTVCLGGQTTRFRKSLKLYQRFHIETRMRRWDNKWFYVEHVFRNTRHELVAVGMSRAAFRSANGWVSTREVMEVVDPGVESLPLTVDMLAWSNAEAEFEARIRSEGAFVPGESNGLQV